MTQTNRTTNHERLIRPPQDIAFSLKKLAWRGKTQAQKQHDASLRFVRAARDGKEKDVAYFLDTAQKNNFNVNFQLAESLEADKLEKGDTALIAAARNGHEVIVMMLAAFSGIDLSLQNSKGHCAWRVAVSASHTSIADFIRLKTVPVHSASHTTNNQQANTQQSVIKWLSDNTHKPAKGDGQTASGFHLSQLVLNKDRDQVTFFPKRKWYCSLEIVSLSKFIIAISYISVTILFHQIKFKS